MSVKLGNATTFGAGGAAVLEDALLFTSPNDFTLGVYDSTKHWDGTLEWTNGTTPWQIWDGTTVLQSRHGFLALRGTGNTCITGGQPTYRFVLTGADIRCSGNIETLLDYRTVAEGNHPLMGAWSYCFSYLFYGCAALTAAPALPATKLADGCYMGMFYDCTSLTTAPALPATALTGPVSPLAPDTLGPSNSCYMGMFKGCTSLREAPVLPATTLAPECYAEMFMGCTSLRTAPVLPATTLARECYLDMFRGCTSLKLSTVRGGDYQYEYRIPSAGTGTDGGNALSDMFTGTGGTFTGTPTINTTYYTTNESGGGGSVSVEALNVSANGTYQAESGKAYSPVTVAVPNSYSASDEGKVVDNAALVSQSSTTVTENGTYDTTKKNEVVVAIPTGNEVAY